MGKIFITRMIPKPGILALKTEGHTVTVWPEDRVIPRVQLLKRIKGMDAVMTMLTDKVDGAFLDAAGPQLKVVANFAVGFDNLDLVELKKRNVAATNTPMVLNEAVAEHTFALMLAVTKRLPESERFLRKGKYKGWAPLLLLGTELKGKTLGIVGTGRIGSDVARRAHLGLGMKIMYYDVKRNEAFEKDNDATYGTLEEVLKAADVVSLHVPLLPSTRHLIDAKRLKLMKKTAYLVNTARGPVVDEAALAQALKAKRIAGAALDVFEHEPKVHPLLLKLENAVLTPHTASATVEARDGMAMLAAGGIAAALAGQAPKNLIKS